MNKINRVFFLLLMLLFISNSSLAQKKEEVKEHSPKKAVLLSLALPGTGQIYNKKYWKLPIVYGALAGSTAYLIYNHNKFKGFDKAITQRENGEVDKYANVYSDISALRINAANFRNERDRAILITVGIYLLQIADAYVDAHLFNYDVSDDLSLNINPAFNYDFQSQSMQSGIALNINLK